MGEHSSIVLSAHAVSVQDIALSYFSSVAPKGPQPSPGGQRVPCTLHPQDRAPLPLCRAETIYLTITVLRGGSV